MTSTERHEARYRRRIAKRNERKAARNAGCSFDKVTSFESLLKAFYSCRKGTNWKASVQRYGANVLRNSYNISRDLRCGKNISKGFVEFTVSERGKTRNIKSVHITERVAQKALCDYGLVPVIEKSLIYNNGASQKNKGTEFASRRLINDLRRYYRKYGNDGYIILGDSHRYFESIDHRQVEHNNRLWLSDTKLIDYGMRYINAFNCGLGLGSQVCQINAVGYTNSIDHYITDTLHCKYYGKYMDDWYLIARTKEQAHKLLTKISARYDQLGLALNTRKTQIVKLSHVFIWLQDRYVLTDTGKVIRRPCRKRVNSDIRKLNKLIAMMDSGGIGYKDVASFYSCVMGYLKYKNAYHIKKRIMKLFNDKVIKRWEESHEQDASHQH